MDAMNMNAEEVRKAGAVLDHVCEGLKLGAAVAAFLVEVKRSKEMQAMLKALPELAGELRPLLEALGDWLTDRDIAAVKRMQEAGISQKHAVALRMRERPALPLLQLLHGARERRPRG